MINFIIYTDEDAPFADYKREVDNFMMKYDTNYQCQLFKENTKKWKEQISDISGFKVYIIDIKGNYEKAIKIAKVIRKELDDWNSMIIILTSSETIKYEILGTSLMILAFINKKEKWNKYLKEALRISIKHYDNRPKILKYNYKGVFYNIEYKNIIYIEKELDSKLCILHTSKYKFPYPGTINKLIETLDSRFIKASRSLIINLEKIRGFNSKNNILYFSNGTTSNAVSRDKKKDVVRHVRGLE